MKYLKDTERLLRIIEILNMHETDVKEYYRSHLAPRLVKIQNTKDKLAVLFAIANSQRQGLGENKISVKTATAGFYQGIEQNIRESMSIATSKEAYLRFLSWLCNIPGMDQKTANLLLKWVIMFKSDFQINLMDWQSWKFHLHVPLDLWVVRLMSKKYLNFCSENYEHDFLKGEEKLNGANLSLKKEEYILLQEELEEAITVSNKPKIILDNLWFVGAFFCNYHPIICDSCWIKKECRNYEYPPEWGSIITKTKDELKKERREQKKKEHQLLIEWMKQHPEQVEEVRKKNRL